MPKAGSIHLDVGFCETCLHAFLYGKIDESLAVDRREMPKGARARAGAQPGNRSASRVAYLRRPPPQMLCVRGPAVCPRLDRRGRRVAIPTPRGDRQTVADPHRACAATLNKPLEAGHRAVADTGDARRGTTPEKHPNRHAVPGLEFRLLERDPKGEGGTAITAGPPNAVFKKLSYSIGGSWDSSVPRPTEADRGASLLSAIRDPATARSTCRRLWAGRAQPPRVRQPRPPRGNPR